MRGWRTKFIFLLIVYFAGFASAIYALAPTPQDHNGVFNTDFQVSKFAMECNSGLHKAIGAGKQAAQHAAKFLRAKYEEYQSQSNS